jgi:OTU domain-containing protein 5
MEQDGACLFRAVADQVYGDQEMHAVVRSHCMDYIVSMEISLLYENN